MAGRQDEKKKVSCTKWSELWILDLDRKPLRQASRQEKTKAWFRIGVGCYGVHGTGSYRFLAPKRARERKCLATVGKRLVRFYTFGPCHLLVSRLRVLHANHVAFSCSILFPGASVQHHLMPISLLSLAFFHPSEKRKTRHHKTPVSGWGRRRNGWAMDGRA